MACVNTDNALIKKSSPIKKVGAKFEDNGLISR